MSTSDRRRQDQGFSLIEIVVAMGLLSVVLLASLPMFLSMLKSTVIITQQTQGKNLAQERLEQVRDLRFHVANQNGPYLDLLDIYYTDAEVAYNRPAVTVGSDVLTGKWISTGGGTNGEPAAPFYRVTIDNLAGAPGFKQTVAAQFLEADGKTVLPTARFSSYDSQQPGVDAPPSLTMGVTVITTWTEGSKQKSYRTYTQVTETRPEKPAIQSQARAVGVAISSTAPDSTSLVLEGGVASLDGSQSSGSAVSGYAGGALARRTGQAVVEGKNARFQLPTQPVVEAGTGGPGTPSGCTWYGFGSSSVDNVTGDVAAGLPRSPANVDDGSSPRKAISGRLLDSSSNSCGVLGFTTVVDTGAPRSDAVGAHMGNGPYVKLPDGGGSSSTALSGSVYVTATALTATPQRTRAGGRTTMARPIVLFPGAPDSGGVGLVTAQLTSASVDCTSGTPGTVAAEYALTLKWWGKVGTEIARWHMATWTYNSASNPAPVLSAGSESWDPTVAVLSDGLRLSDLVTGDAPGAGTSGAATGQRGFPNGILTLNTASTLSNESAPGFSSIKVQLGQLTCVADDER